MNFHWIGTRAREALSILPCFPIASGFILEDDRAPFPCRSVQRISGEKRTWGCDDLEHPLLTKLYSTYTRDYERPVISYRPARPNDVHYDRAIWKIDSELDRIFSDKYHSRIWLSQKGLPVVPYTKISSGETRFSAWKISVLQALQGSGGRFTYMGKTDKLLHYFACCGPVSPTGRWNEALLSPFITGPIINIHAAVLPDGFREIARPSIQRIALTEDKGLYRPFYAGNDFNAFWSTFSRIQAHRLHSLMDELAFHMAGVGYLGIFGADLVYSPRQDEFYFLEINARLQGSTCLLSRLEREQGQQPLALQTFRAMYQMQASQ